MTFASDDFDRVMFADALVEVPDIWEVKGLRRAAILRFTRDAVYRQINQGERDAAVIKFRVNQEVVEEYGSVVLSVILMAIVSFIVQRILERIFPKEG